MKKTKRILAGLAVLCALVLAIGTQGDAASVLFLNTAATTVTLKPGACFVYTDPSAGGTAVTGTTADIVQIAPSAGTVAYSIIIMGSSS